MWPITTLAAAVLLITSSAAAIQRSSPDSPKVVLIMTDDFARPSRDRSSMKSTRTIEVRTVEGFV